MKCHLLWDVKDAFHIRFFVLSDWRKTHWSKQFEQRFFASWFGFSAACDDVFTRNTSCMLSCKIARSFWSCSSMCMDVFHFPNKFQFPNNSNALCWKQMHTCKMNARHAHECSFWMTCCLLLRFSERQSCYWLLICSILLVIVWFSAEWFPHPTLRFFESANCLNRLVT